MKNHRPQIQPLTDPALHHRLLLKSDVYMQSLGCLKLNFSTEEVFRYLYPVDPQTNVLSRLNAWDFSIKTSADFHTDGIVSRIKAKEYYQT